MVYKGWPFSMYGNQATLPETEMICGGSFAIISTMSAPFCSTCNRMRLTADGKLKNCLFSTGETDLLLHCAMAMMPLIHASIQSCFKNLSRK